MAKLGTEARVVSASALPRRTQEQRRAATREALLNAAIDSICEIGLNATTLGMIADRARVTRGALQHHFGSRDDVLAAVIEVVRELNFDIDLAATRALPLGERIDAILACYRAAFTSKPFLAALNIWLGIQGEPALLERLQGIIASMQPRIQEIWLRVFEDLDLDPRQLQSARRIVMSTVRGYTIQQMFGVDSDWDSDAAALRSMLLEHFLRQMPR
jgi:AcrR family transcriptional regulator